MEVRDSEMLTCFVGDREPLVYPGQGAMVVTGHGLKFCEQSVVRWSVALVASSEVGFQRLPEPEGPGLWIELPTTSPVRVHLTNVSVSPHVVLFCQCEQGFRAEARGSSVSAAACNNGLKEERPGDRCGMAQFSGTSGRRVGKLPCALELPQMPFCQREKVHRTHLSVIAKANERISVSFTDVVAQSALEDGSRRLQVAELEQNKTEYAASHTGFRGAPVGFGFPKEGFGCFTRLAMLAPHEACQALPVVGDKACIRAFGWSCEFSRALVGGAHIVGGKALQPHRCMTIIGVQLQKSARNTRVSSPLLRRCSLHLVGHLNCLAEMGDRLLVRRAAQRVLARLAPPVDRHVVEPGLPAVMRHSLRLPRGLDQRLRRASVQRLTAAPQKAVVSRVLNQRVLEAKIGRASCRERV